MTLSVHSWGKFNLAKLKANILNISLGYQNKQKSTNKVSSEHLDFPGSSDSKESACNAGDSGLILGLGKSLGERNGNLLQYSYLNYPMERGAWQVIVHRVSKSHTKLSMPVVVILGFKGE